LQRAYEDLRRTQEAVLQQERLRTLEQMASGIGHDINNALSPAALCVQLLLENEATTLDDETREYLMLIQRAIDDVGNTITRMRLFYGPRETELPLSAVDVNALIKQVVDLTRARWKDIPQERGLVVALKSELAPDLPRVMGSENEI